MEKIIAGIVLYNPDIKRLKMNLEAVINQVRYVVLYDNYSTNIEDVINLLKNYRNITLLRSKKNNGIAVALNSIFNYAHINYNVEYVLTLDQDSICPNNLITEYLKHYDPKVGIYTPKIKDLNGNIFLSALSNNKVDELQKCITSAALTSYKAWKEINGFDESMFIDCVDFDFCNRIRRKKYKIIRVNSVVLSHEIGHIRTYHIFNKIILIKNHSAFRKYYIARNTIYTARKMGKTTDITISYLRVIKQILLVVLFESNKFSKIKALFKGVFDGSKMMILKKWT